MESFQVQEFNKTKRIEYIDALRGFTMITVVYSHILYVSYHILYVSYHTGNSFPFSFCDIIIPFYMPLFFFISGFVFFKESLFLTLKETFQFLIKRMKHLIVPTLFFLGLYIYIFRPGIMNVIESPFKGGYWFTLILFIYFCLFSLSYYGLGRFHLKTNKILMGIFLFSILIYCLSTNPIIISRYTAHILSLSQYKFFTFFVLGTIVKYKYNKIKNLIGKNLFSTSTILAFIGTTIFLETKEIQSYYLKLVFQTIQSFSGVLFIFMFFEKNQKWCSHETKVGRALQYIGKRTLDIYLIHYFFLPSNLLILGKFFTDYPNPTVEFFISMLLVLLVLSLSLVTSNLLRCSDFLTEWLFGRKKRV